MRNAPPQIPDPGRSNPLTHGRKTRHTCYEVLREVIVDRSHVGEVATIPADLARWIVALREPLHGLTPLQVHDVARLYAARVVNDRSTSDIDVWMAFRPWRMSVDDLADWNFRVADFDTYSIKRPPLHFVYADPYREQEAVNVPE